MVHVSILTRLIKQRGMFIGLRCVYKSYDSYDKCLNKIHNKTTVLLRILILNKDLLFSHKPKQKHMDIFIQRR